EEFDKYIDEQLRFEDIIYEIFEDKVNGTCASEKMKEALLEIACLMRERDIPQQEIQNKLDGIADNFNETEVIELNHLWLTISEEAMIEAKVKFENGNYTMEAVGNFTEMRENEANYILEEVETDNFENELLSLKNECH
ncbi:unnamed protein product, partial [Wuchereria bancrofti]